VIEILLQAEAALSIGLLDRAEILYRQIVMADPRNSIAVVGLARVALERGDESGALVQAKRALAIDAENAAAQRMVQRLDEVLRFRGGQRPPEVGAAPGPRTESAMESASEAGSVSHERPSSAADTEAPGSAAAPSPLSGVTGESVAGDQTPGSEPPRRSIVDRLLRRR